MSIRIVFSVMSATQQSATVAQLARSLAPHVVLIHHDFSKNEDFRVEGPNVRFVPNPTVTGWGSWGLSRGIFNTIECALRTIEFDYLHLLSPTCLPIRPIGDLESFIAASEVDIHADMFEVERDEQTLMNFGCRAYAYGDSFKYRALGRLRKLYFGVGKDAILEQTCSLSMWRRSPHRAVRGLGLVDRLALSATQAAARGWLGSNPFSQTFRPMIGSLWIGMKRRVCEYLIRSRNSDPVSDYFAHLKIVDEMLFPTLLANSPFKVGPAIHAVNDFDPFGSPYWITDADLDRIFATDRYLARKFPDNPAAPVRARALERAGVASPTLPDPVTQ
jgi:hypothetical protein